MAIFLAALALLWCAPPALAGDFLWVAPAECAGQAEVRAEIERQLPHAFTASIAVVARVETSTASRAGDASPASRAREGAPPPRAGEGSPPLRAGKESPPSRAGEVSPPLRVAKGISASSVLWVAEIEVRSRAGRGVRRIEARSCALAVRAAILVVTLALARALEAEAARVPIVPAEVLEVAPEPGGPGIVWSARAGAGALFGMLPAGTVELDVAVAMELASLRLELGVFRTLSSHRSSVQVPSAGGEFALTAASASICHARALDTADLFLCARGELGVIDGRGVGVSEAQRARLSYLAVSAGPAVSVPITDRWRVYAGIDAVVPVLRSSFVVLNIGEIHRPRLFGARAIFGIEISWGRI